MNQFSIRSFTFAFFIIAVLLFVGILSFSLSNKTVIPLLSPQQHDEGESLRGVEEKTEGMVEDRHSGKSTKQKTPTRNHHEEQNVLEALLCREEEEKGNFLENRLFLSPTSISHKAEYISMTEVMLTTREQTNKIIMPSGRKSQGTDEEHRKVLWEATLSSMEKTKTALFGLSQKGRRKRSSHDDTSDRQSTTNSFVMGSVVNKANKDLLWIEENWFAEQQTLRHQQEIIYQNMQNHAQWRALRRTIFYFLLQIRRITNVAEVDLVQKNQHGIPKNEKSFPSPFSSLFLDSNNRTSHIVSSLFQEKEGKEFDRLCHYFPLIPIPITTARKQKNVEKEKKNIKVKLKKNFNDVDRGVAENFHPRFFISENLLRKKKGGAKLLARRNGRKSPGGESEFFPGRKSFLPLGCSTLSKIFYIGGGVEGQCQKEEESAASYTLTNFLLDQQDAFQLMDQFITSLKSSDGGKGDGFASEKMLLKFVVHFIAVLFPPLHVPLQRKEKDDDKISQKEVSKIALMLFSEWRARKNEKAQRNKQQNTNMNEKNAEDLQQENGKGISSVKEFRASMSGEQESVIKWMGKTRWLMSRQSTPPTSILHSHQLSSSSMSSEGLPSKNKNSLTKNRSSFFSPEWICREPMKDSDTLPFLDVIQSNPRMTFYNVKNVCIHPHGGGLSGKFFSPHDDAGFSVNQTVFSSSKKEAHKKMILNGILDEKRAPIRNEIYIRSRKHFPSCFVEKPLLLHPVIFQSDNLGHVLYRVLQTRLLQEKFHELKGGQYDETILGFYVLPSSKLTFGASVHKYKLFYDLLLMDNKRRGGDSSTSNQQQRNTWFSVFGPPKLFGTQGKSKASPSSKPFSSLSNNVSPLASHQPTKNKQDQEQDISPPLWMGKKGKGSNDDDDDEKKKETEELCFSNAFIGWDQIPMYANKKYPKTANLLQRKYAPFITNFRDQILFPCVLGRKHFRQRANSQLTAASSSLQEEKDVTTTAGDDDVEWIIGSTAAQHNTAAATERKSKSKPKIHHHHHQNDVIRVTFISRSSTRRLRNELKLMTLLARRYKSKSTSLGDRPLDKKGGDSEQYNFEFHLIDFEDMSLQQQVSIVSETDILIGVHGTAMQWTLVQPKNAVLIELQYPGYGCTSPGVNHPSRRFCEYGQTSMIAEVTHIVHRVSANLTRCPSAAEENSKISENGQKKDDEQRVHYSPPSHSSMRTSCDILLEEDKMFQLMEQAICALRVGAQQAGLECEAHMLKSGKLLSDLMES